MTEAILSGEEIGLDLGATLTKAVVVEAGSSLADFQTFLFPSGDRASIAAFLASRRSPHLAATGAGARRLAKQFTGDRPVFIEDEFQAWGLGEEALLIGADFVPSCPHLLVSLGTGTSILRVETGEAVVRVGGTGLGGGTLQGFGRLLLDETDYDTLTSLAAQGDRRRVDLLVRDLYGAGEIPLSGDLTAANLGRVLSRDPRDLAHAIVGLIGENVGLLAGALARGEIGAAPLDIVYAGATLRANVALHDVLAFTSNLVGATARFLPYGEYVGAVGALVAARRSRA
jgi:type II pantothenate kinase